MRIAIFEFVEVRMHPEIRKAQLVTVKLYRNESSVQDLVYAFALVEFLKVFLPTLVQVAGVCCEIIPAPDVVLIVLPVGGRIAMRQDLPAA